MLYNWQLTGKNAKYLQKGLIKSGNHLFNYIANIVVKGEMSLIQE